MDMTFSDPWQSEVSFKGYIAEHQHVIGREWLFLEVEHLLQNSSYGVLITAEMGFGKSAFLSQMTCLSRADQPGFTIRSRMVAFHMCKFDSVLTLKPHIFITNLAGSISRLHPEFNQTLFDDTFAKDYIFKNRCQEDPMGCFDAVILHVVQRMKNTKQKFIIVIDGMDECLEHGSSNIVSLLSSRLHKMKDFFQIIATSRRIPSVLSALNLLQHHHIHCDRKENKLEVLEYVHQHPDTNIRDKFITKDIFTSLSLWEQKLLEVSKWNFLFVVHFLSSPTVSLHEVPVSLFHMYKLNFDRIFASSITSFDELRPVFEILVASFSAIDESELYDILQVTESERSKLHKAIHESLGHFVRTFENKLSFYHKAVSDFLVDQKSNHKYTISKTAGHRKIALHHLKIRSNIFYIVHHIAESKNSLLELQIIKEGKSIVRQNNMNLVGDYNVIQSAAVKLRSHKAMELLLRVVGCRHVDDLTVSGNTAAFLAAASGNLEILRALHECGANLIFKRHEPPLQLCIGDIEDPVNFCKDSSLWGYTLLHVASRYGHRTVVDFLLDKEPNSLTSTNSLGLNAFHVAVENAHTQIVKMFLWINPSFADNHSLYYAAKNNYVDIVDILLYHGVKDDCMTCTGEFYWINENKKRIQNKYQWFDNPHDQEEVVFMDDSRLIRCETALEVAVQMGNAEVIKLLLGQNATGIHCRQYEGRTPILTSALYNRPDIFRILLSHGANLFDRTTERQTNSTDISRMCFYQLKNYNENTGNYKFNATVAHIAAIYGNMDILDILPETLLNSVDTSLETPLHYTVCKKVHHIVTFLRRKKVSTSIQTKTGATPLHIAAFCENLELLLKIKNANDFASTFDMVDFENRTFVHYLFLQPRPLAFYDLINMSWENEKYKRKYFSFFLNMKHLDMTARDSHGRTPFHYASITGNPFPFEYFLEHSKIKYCPMSEEPDINGSTPLDLLFINLPEIRKLQHDIEYMYSTAHFPDIYIKGTTVTQIPQYVQCIASSLWFCYQTKLRLHDERLKTYIKQALSKNNLFGILVLKSALKDQYWKAIQNLKIWILNNIFYLDKSGSLYRHIIDPSFRFCNEPFEYSFFHKAIYNENNLYWLYHKHGFSLFGSFMNKHIKLLHTCYDKEGFTLLHRSIMGGNVQALSFLMSQMTSSNEKTKTGQNVTSLLLDYTPFFDREEFLKWSVTSQKKKLNIQDDIFVTDVPIASRNYNGIVEILVQHHMLDESFIVSNLCDEEGKGLSKIHIFAAKGLTSLLNIGLNMHGKNILQCRNVHGFTPLFFANVFGHTDTVAFLEQAIPNIHDVLDTNAEIMFVMYSLSKYFDEQLSSYIREICEIDDKHSLLATFSKYVQYIKTSFKTGKNISTIHTLRLNSIDSVINLFDESAKVLPTSLLKELIISYLMTENKYVVELRGRFIRYKMEKTSVHESIRRYGENLNRRWQKLTNDRRFPFNYSFVCDPQYTYLNFLPENEKEFIAVPDKNITLKSMLEFASSNSYIDWFSIIEGAEIVSFERGKDTSRKLYPYDYASEDLKDININE